jgi:hypothetical protein
MSRVQFSVSEVNDSINPTIVALEYEGPNYRSIEELGPQVPIQAEVWVIIGRLSAFYCLS